MNTEVRLKELGFELPEVPKYMAKYVATWGSYERFRPRFNRSLCRFKWG